MSGVPPVRLALVRHGEAEGNRELRYLGSSDVPLTARGRAQAARAARGVRRLAPAALYTSPLARARATAEALAATTGLAPVEDARLREQDFGAWERHTRAEVAATDGARLAAWEAGEAEAPTDGEPLAAVRARAEAWARAMAARYPGATIVAVSHVGPIKLLVCAALGLPAAGMRRMWLDPASLTVIEWSATPRADGSGGVLRAFNAAARLGNLAAWAARSG